MATLKILMVCEFFNPELGFQENLLLKYYRKMGHEVTIVTSTYLSVFDYYAGRHDKRAPASTQLHLGAKIIRLPFRYNLINKLKSYRDFAQVMAAESPDLIFVHDVTPDFPAMARYVKSRPLVRMIMDCHADHSNSGKNWLSLKFLHGIVRRYFLDSARPYLSKIFPIVPASFTFLNEVYGVPMAEMELLPLGADLDMIDAIKAEKPRAAIRNRYGIKETDFVIVTGGKLERRKKLELLAKAVCDCGHKDVHVLAAGTFPPDDADYRAIVEEAAGSSLSQIHFVGWLGAEEMFRHMAASDIAIFPASQSVLWLQALASSLPLLVGDTGGQDVSYVNLNDNIIIMKAKDISAQTILSHIQALHADRSRLKAMGAGAQATAREMLDWNALAKKTLSFSFE
jgi:1,2-diacylglycerol 3-alpha-glucosyltransferase